MPKDSLSEFLTATPFCDPTHAVLKDKAQDIAQQHTGRKAADLLFIWIRENITYEILGLESAEGTLKRGRGCCLAKSNLMVAFSRTLGIPARYFMFEGCLNSPQAYIAKQRLLHVVPEVFVDDAWITGDPAYESTISHVYETGELGKCTWSDLKKEKRMPGLQRWLWAGQRLAILISPDAWKIRSAIRKK